VKELEEDVTLVSRHRDTLGVIWERDEALSSASREIEVLRATVRDRDDALQALEKTCGGLRDEAVGW
jgi:hypothetical protein